MTRLWAKLGSLHADLTPPNLDYLNDLEYNHCIRQRDFYILTLFLVLFKGFKLAVFGLPTHSPLFVNALKMWLTNFLCALS